ncbi:CoA transferase [Gordonia humi]|uniref:Crotonobetainyl-CoA:carnitine CoA-transferase CaiB-like acyl-CoA transferase n=1 Tax=Gordonia humi TaxID=686429 RepID=A0A840EX87_9ACTN|nr:CoA transferase [Gordonia humi]MBB4133539.1 crotonobetainyl-CoA:carnitine CoA-transferase CaiB-like acyl-CoA transferase [Gordonia humi]
MTTTSTPEPGLLNDTVTIEIGRSRSAAFAGKLIADMGGDVIVVDDDARRAALPESARAFLDPYKDAIGPPADRSTGWLDEVLCDELVPHADLIITDLPEDELRRRGWDFESVNRLNPRISHVRLTAAPGADEGGELTMQARSGLMEMVGSPDREPLALPNGIGSLQLGLHGAAAANTALLVARRTGRGRRVEIAGSEVLASYVRIYGAVASYYDIPLRRDGRRAPGSGGRYPFGLFPCKDGYVAMITRSQREWESMLAMMGDPEWSELDRYRDLYAIAMDYPDEVDELVAPWLMAHSRDEILDLAQEHAVPAAPVRSVDEVLDDPQLSDHRGFFDEVEISGGRRLRVPGRPWATSERTGRLETTDLDTVLARRAAARPTLSTQE